MAIARTVREALVSSSMIRKLFEEGRELKKKYGGDRVFDFSIGNPDLEPPPAFHRVLKSLAGKDAEGKTPGSHGYMPNAGYPEVREILAQKASREQGCTVPASHIIMSVGAAGGLNVVFKSILDPGDEVIVSRPFFMEYRPYTANHGGILVEAPGGRDFGLDLAAIEQALSPKTAAVLINSPHNPTGRVYPAGDIAALADLLRRWEKKSGRRPWLVADEPYREIVYGGLTVPPVLSAYEESIAVTSYSKSLSLPGERIGYIALSPAAEDAETVLGALIYATRVLGYVNAPALMQRVVAALTEERVDVETYARRRAAFMDVLDSAGMTYVKPEGAFYIFAQVPSPGAGTDTAKAAPDGLQPSSGDRAFSELLKKHLVLGVPGSSFGAPGWIRFAYCVDEGVIRASAPALRETMDEWRRPSRPHP
ncbi:MAG: pyridoxal phosphate-dependent aminotransferase [Treponema sp.]|jgi:aspartate aminotransferase|nr:pyridoxal phosphate-dependent aminotransferase [Treponema sp.]